ncbi:MAG: ATP-binding protein [Gemmatimonadetes bacterium]|nr:ATP-binding protein [Gemmatimonadota bacterium]
MRPALSAHLARLGSARRGLAAELTLRVPGDIGVVEEAVELVARHLETSFVDRRAIRFNVRVALAEALANAILYGSGEDAARPVAVRVLFGRHAVEMEVTDEGGGFDPGLIPDPTLPANRSRPYGRGLFVIRGLVDEVRFSPKGNSICMVVRRA